MGFRRQTKILTITLILLFQVLLALQPLSHVILESDHQSQLQITVGDEEVTLLPHNVAFTLEQEHSEVQGHSVIENFLTVYQPIWCFEGLYFNATVWAPEPVGATMLVALNQTGWWQLIFSSNGTLAHEVVWTCTVTSTSLPVNATHILLTAINRFRFHLPDEPLRLNDIHLAVSGGNPPVRQLCWHLSFSITVGAWRAFILKIDTNGTVIHESLLQPPGGSPPLSSLLIVFLMAGIGTFVISILIIGYVRLRHTLIRILKDRQGEKIG